MNPNKTPALEAGHLSNRVCCIKGPVPSAWRTCAHRVLNHRAGCGRNGIDWSFKRWPHCLGYENMLLAACVQVLYAAGAGMVVDVYTLT